MYRREHPTETSRGFTLIELMIVIGVMTVLAMMLLPSIAEARKTARIVQCVSNLRQIGQAAIMAKLYVAPGTSEVVPPGLWVETLSPFVQNEWRIFVCPEGDKYDAVSGARSSEEGGSGGGGGGDDDDDDGGSGGPYGDPFAPSTYMETWSVYTYDDNPSDGLPDMTLRSYMAPGEGQSGGKFDIVDDSPWVLHGSATQREQWKSDGGVTWGEPGAWPISNHAAMVYSSDGSGVDFWGVETSTVHNHWVFTRPFMKVERTGTSSTKFWPSWNGYSGTGPATNITMVGLVNLSGNSSQGSLQLQAGKAWALQNPANLAPDSHRGDVTTGPAPVLCSGPDGASDWIEVGTPDDGGGDDDDGGGAGDDDDDGGGSAGGETERTVLSEETNYGFNESGSGVRKASHKILVMDYVHPVAKASDDWTAPVYDGDLDGVLDFLRHRRRLNVLFADGSVRLHDADSTDPADPVVEADLWQHGQ